MSLLNTYDIENALIASARPINRERPNLHTAARVLTRLASWTNGNSDGWSYWRKPSQASSKLQEHLYREFIGRYDERTGCDITDEELKAAIRPIKAFITRQINAGHMKPWAREQILGEAL